ncbi:hypothetical protein XENOCAPTIV_021570 [Xenoophorus captivus]|uniref:Uncharacterized protein n=1 Tax=Xenoophorus captivus TaxID=1517983 RepID=A0ABV0QW75_9TELE
MPVHREREKKESVADEMEVEEQEHEASTSDEEESDTSSVSEDGDTSGEETQELYRERLSQVNCKLAAVEAGRAAEYLDPLAVLLENMQVRTKVAGKFD